MTLEGSREWLDRKGMKNSRVFCLVRLVSLTMIIGHPPMRPCLFRLGERRGRILMSSPSDTIRNRDWIATPKLESLQINYDTASVCAIITLNISCDRHRATRHN